MRSITVGAFHLVGRRCQIDECGAPAWRFCRVCARWACRDHRFGSGWWWRCVFCPYERLAELLRAERERRLLCHVCDAPMIGRWVAGILWQRPSCDCWVILRGG